MRVWLTVAAMMIVVAGHASANDGVAAVECLREKAKVEGATLDGNRLRFSVTNGLSWPISAFRAKLTIRSDGRSVPWHTDESGYQISGGVEPGEVRTVTFWNRAVDEPVPACVLSALIYGRKCNIRIVI